MYSIMMLDGSCGIFLGSEYTRGYTDVTWSGCQHYLSGVQEASVYGAAPAQGFIWSVKTQRRCFTWHVNRQGDNAPWSAKGSKCLLPSCGLILTMSAQGHEGPSQLTHFDAPSQGSDNPTRVGANSGGSNNALMGRTDTDRLCFSPC